MTDAAKAQAEDDCSDERSIPANSMSPFVADFVAKVGCGRLMPVGIRLRGDRL